MNARGLLLACVLTTLATGPVLATEPASNSKSVGQESGIAVTDHSAATSMHPSSRGAVYVGKVRMWQKSST